MNRSKIEWCDHTWNPITGCRHGCEYCYARTMTARFSGDVRLNKSAKADYKLVDAADGGEQLYVLDKPMINDTGNPLVYPFGFEPTYHKYRLDRMKTLKMGNNIFVGAMSDIWGDWVPESWISEILSECEKRPEHNYLFLTKNPERYTKVKVPSRNNHWYGTSITGAGDIGRFNYLPAGCKTFVSVEPLLSPLPKDLVMYRQINWIIIGAETGHRKGKVIPKPEWIEEIVAEADANNIPVFMKDSLIPIIGEKNMRRDYPEELLHKNLSKKIDAKLYTICASCKKKLKKREMITLLGRQGRGIYPVQYGYMCKDCFGEMCKKLSIDNPFQKEESE